MQPVLTIPEIKKIAIELLVDSIQGVEAIYLFGSIAEGNATDKSDIDLAFLSDQEMPNITRFEIQENLAALVSRDVDLVDLIQASEVMRFQVISKGLRIFTKNYKSAEDFEDKVYYLYLDLCELRQPILDNIQETGSIYG